MNNIEALWKTITDGTDMQKGQTFLSGETVKKTKEFKERGVNMHAVMWSD